jgi:hypothetical protein
MTLAGLEFSIITLAMPLIFGDASEIYSQPQVSITIAGGLILYFCGRKLQKRLIPREYNLTTEWGYSVIKK